MLMDETQAPSPFLPRPSFVGRESERRAYHLFLTLEDGPWLLLISGQSGNGKSSLLQQLKAETASPFQARLLDFNATQLQGNILHLAAEISQALRPITPASDFQEFWQEYKQGRDRLTQMPSTLSQQVHAEAGASVQHVPLSINVNDTMNQVRREVADQITLALLQLASTAQATPIVLLLDTCERLEEPAGQEVRAWLFRDLLPPLRERLGGRLRVVAAGRERLSTSYAAGETHHLPLGLLSAVELDGYLQHLGMQDAALRQAVYGMTRGHPLCVTFVTEVWQKSGQHAFTSADLPTFQGQFSERAITEWVTERILDRMQPTYRDLVKYGVLLRSFDLPLLRAVFPELLDAQDAVFQQLIRYSFIYRLASGRYAFHGLLRQVLAGHIRSQLSEQWQLYHERALQFWDQQTEQVAGKDLPQPDYFYHLLAAREEQGIAEWEAAFYLASMTDERNYAGRLLQAAESETLDLQPPSRALLAYHQGRFLYARDQGQAAITSYQQALDLFRAQDNPIGEAIALLGLADLYARQNQADAAQERYQQTLALARQHGHRLLEANALKGLGTISEFKNERDAAVERYRQALTIFQEEDEAFGEAEVRKALGDVLQYRNQPAEALTHYRQALALYRQVGSRTGEANILQMIGTVLHAAHREDALTNYQQALTIYRELGILAGEASILRLIGITLAQRGQQNEALAHYQQALQVFRQIGSRLPEGETLRSIAELLALRHQEEEALTLCRQALEIARQIGFRQSECYALGTLGDLLNARGETAEALKCYQDAHLIARQIEDRLGLLITRKGIGDVQRLRKQYQAALTSYREVLALSRQIHHLHGQATALAFIGDVYFAQQQFENALKHYNEALPLLQRLGMRSVELLAHQAIGSIYLIRQQLEEALSHFQQAFALAHETGAAAGLAAAQLGIGTVRLEQGDAESGLRDLNKSLALSQELQDHNGEAEALVTIGNGLLLQQDADAALARYQQALDLFSQSGNVVGQARAHTGIASIFLAREDYEEALTHYQQALTLFEQLGDGFGAAQAYLAIGKLLLLADDLEEALECYEQARQMFQELNDVPREVECSLGMAYTLLGQEQGEQAIELLDQTMQRAQQAQDAASQARLLWARSRVYQETGQQALAIQDAETGLALAVRFNLPSISDLSELMAELRADTD
jgi:tetratricopeptide (TPR) repeat protein